MCMLACVFCILYKITNQLDLGNHDKAMLKGYITIYQGSCCLYETLSIEM